MNRGEILALARKAGLRVEATNVGDGIAVVMSPPMALQDLVKLVEENTRQEYYNPCARDVVGKVGKNEC